MVYYVYKENVNKRCIEPFNIFNNGRFLEDLKKDYKKNPNDKKAFLERLDRLLLYYYWCKCEYEIVLTDWPPSDKFNDEKVDVYSQVIMNWPIFSEYVWNNREELSR